MKLKTYLVLILLISISLLSAAADLTSIQASKKIMGGKDLESNLNGIIRNDDENPQAQLALFELGKLKFLERDYQAAQDYFKRIYGEDITDKEYWLAKTYLKLEDPTRAIISAQNFICDSDDPTKIESAYFLIAESYLLSHQYKRALNTLETLRNSEYIQNFIPLLFYKLGYCHELLDHTEDAILSYKKLKSDYPYHELSFQAEERLLSMRSKPTQNSPQPILTTAVANHDAQTYLQAGAFGSPKNAHSLGSKITNLGMKYIVFDKMSNGRKLYCVAAGPFENATKLNTALTKLKDNQINTYIIKH